MHNEKENILLVDDEEQIIDVIKAYLERDGYRVFTANNGMKAIDIFNKEKVDLIILDLMLPDLSGEEICKKIRLESQVPIIMLTAKAEEENRINGLDIGADDYIVKPFSPKEIVARVRAVLRRTKVSPIKATVLEFNNGDLNIDTNKKEVKKKGKEIKLTPTELDLLLLLSQNIGKTFSREELISKILGYDYEGFDRTIDTHVKNLRHKIEGKEFQYIKTVYGIGYKFIGG